MTTREIYKIAYRALRVMEHQRPTQTYAEHLQARIHARNHMMRLEVANLVATEAARESRYLHNAEHGAFFQVAIAS